MERDDDALAWLRERLDDPAMLTSGQEEMYRRAVDRIEHAESILRKLIEYAGPLTIDDGGGVVIDAFVYLTDAEQSYVRSFE